MTICASLIRSSKRRLATGSRLPLITRAVSTKLAAERRRLTFLSIAIAQTLASGSSRRMAINADESMIIAAARGRHKAIRHDRPNETALSAAWRSPSQSPTDDRRDCRFARDALGQDARGRLS